MNKRSLATNVELPRFFDINAAVEYAHGLLRGRRREFRDRGLFDPVDWLSPPTLSEMLGLTYEVVPKILFADRPNGRVALGLLDLSKRSALVSEERGLEVARYTGAHELGHYLYHQRRVRRHWERGLDPAEKDPQEREANQFAARFLMPKSLLTRRLTENFCMPPIRIDESWLYFLLGDQIDPDSKELDLEYALAKANRNTRYQQIVPLHQQFRVSKQAMAIRLQEVRALEYPVTSYRTDL